MQGHTPGPWGQEYDGSVVMGGQVIAEPDRLAPDFASREEARANARLISAAPEMLEAIRNILWKLSHNWSDGLPGRIDRNDAVIRMAQQAYEKATQEVK